MLPFFVACVLLLVLSQTQKNHGPNEWYTVTFSFTFSPFAYDFFKALAVALIVAILTN